MNMQNARKNIPALLALTALLASARTSFASPEDEVLKPEASSPSEGPAPLPPPEVASAPIPPAAQPSAPSVVDAAATPKPPGPPARFRLALTMREGFSGDDGFDQIAKSNYVPAIGLEATGVFVRRGRFSLAVGALGEIGGVKQNVRGIETGLTQVRLLAPLEGRLAIFPWLEARARLAPGVTYVDARFDRSTYASYADGWAFSTEGALGGSVRFVGDREKNRTIELWGLVDGGYVLSSSVALDASRTPPDKQLGAQGQTSFGDLSPRAGFLRFALALAF